MFIGKDQFINDYSPPTSWEEIVNHPNQDQNEYKLEMVQPANTNTGKRWDEKYPSDLSSSEVDDICATRTVIGQTSYIVVNNHHTVSRTRYRDSFRGIATRVVTILPLGNRTSKVYHRLSVNGSTKYHAISPLL